MSDLWIEPLGEYVAEHDCCPRRRHHTSVCPNRCQAIRYQLGPVWTCGLTAGHAAAHETLSGLQWV